MYQAFMDFATRYKQYLLTSQPGVIRQSYIISLKQAILTMIGDNMST